MADPGYHKEITSRNPNLEVKRAGMALLCAGVAIERGARPGPLQDVWMWSRSRRCQSEIKHGQLYVGNFLIPPRIKGRVKDSSLPLCLYCALDAYSEYFEGPKKVDYLVPLTAERREAVLRGLANVLEDADALSKALSDQAA